MSDNQNILQVTIPAPRYNIGDLVEWSVDFGERLHVYRGAVVYRAWYEDDPVTDGYWEYGTNIQNSYSPSRNTNYTGYDTVTENELKIFIPRR